MFDHADVVADEQIRQVQTVAQIKKQVDDLRLNGDIQRRHRFITDDDFGIDRQRPCDADPLALPSGKLMRIAVQCVLLQSNPIERLDRERTRLRPLDQPMGDGGFGDCIENALTWVQCGGGILENHLNAETGSSVLTCLVHHRLAVE